MENVNIHRVSVGAVEVCHRESNGNTVDRVRDRERKDSLVNGDGCILVVQNIPSVGRIVALAAVIGRKAAFVKGDERRPYLDDSGDIIDRSNAESVRHAALGTAAVVGLKGVERGDCRADPDNRGILLPVK